MLTAAQLGQQAATDARAPNYTASWQQKLQLILDGICLKNDFALARGVYYFPLNPSNITTIGGIQNFGGPYRLPLDYLRTSGSSGSEGVQYSFFYVYNGVPYPLQPWDLGRMDMQVQQPGIQNLPYAFATDVAPESTYQKRIVGTTTAKLVAGDYSVEPLSPNNMAIGQSVAGDGIAPGSQILNMIGQGGAGGTKISLSLPATGTYQGSLENGTQGAGAASIMFGWPVNLFVYPGPSGAFPCTLRYQRLMPPLQDFSNPPWFPDQQYLLEMLTADLMVTTDDTRRDRMKANAEAMLGQYRQFADDKTNRSQTVMLDRQRFGRAFSRLPNTKTIGW